MARDLDEVSDDKLEAHVRARITPELVEMVRRQRPRGNGVSTEAKSSAHFGYGVGVVEGIDRTIKLLERLLSEATNPEAH